jgi:hypothetical protein
MATNDSFVGGWLSNNRADQWVYLWVWHTHVDHVYLRWVYADPCLWGWQKGLKGQGLDKGNISCRYQFRS